jgi:hypothetical protein
MTTLVGNGTNFLLYQDGALTGSTTQAGQWAGSNLVFGRPAQFPTGPADGLFGHKFGGLIGIAEVYSGALGSTDISDLYDLQQPRFYPAPPPPLTKYLSYDFSDPLCYPGTGNTVFDLVNNNDSNLVGSPTFAGTGQSKYLRFLVGQEGQTINPVVTSGAQLTINMWVKVLSFNTGYDCISSFGTGYPASWLYIWSNYINSETYTIDVQTTPPFDTGITPSSTSYDNIILSVGSSTWTAYINGVSVGSTSHTLTSWPVDSDFWMNAADTQGSIRNSNIDLPFIEMYNTGLGSTEAIALYNSQLTRFNPTPPPPPYSGILGGRQFAQGFNG